jgi:hypothetical protein
LITCSIAKNASENGPAPSHAAITASRANATSRDINVPLPTVVISRASDLPWASARIVRYISCHARRRSRHPRLSRKSPRIALATLLAIVRRVFTR